MRRPGPLEPFVMLSFAAWLAATPALGADGAADRAEAAATRAEAAAVRSEEAARRVEEATVRLERLIERLERERTDDRARRGTRR